MIQLLEIAASFAETFFGLWFPAKALKNGRIEWKKRSEERRVGKECGS